MKQTNNTSGLSNREKKYGYIPTFHSLVVLFLPFSLTLMVSVVAAAPTNSAYQECKYIGKVDPGQDVLGQAQSAFRDAFRLDGVPQDIFVYAQTFYTCPCGEWGIGGGTGDSAIGGGSGASAIGGGAGDSAIGGGTGDSAIGGGAGDSAIRGGTGDSAIGGGMGASAIGGGAGGSAIRGGTGDSMIGGGFARLQCRSVDPDSKREFILRIPIGHPDGVRLFDGVTFHPVTVETYGR